MENLFFSPLSVFPACAVMVISLLSIVVISSIRQYDLQSVKYPAFDGLKGYLCMIVVISHSSTWYFYLRTGNWVALSYKIFDQTGKTSMSFFFIMTGFLFCRKLMSGKTDWVKLYVSRLVRLFPVYFTAVISIFIIVGFLTDFSFSAGQSWSTLLSQLKKWLMFTIKRDPDINGFENTWLIICKVTWTLRYEWIFYLALPIFSLLFPKNKINYTVLGLSILLIANVYGQGDLYPILLTPFLGGIIATFFADNRKIVQLALHPSGSFIVMAFVAGLLLIYHFLSISAYDFLPFVIITVVFILILNGNTLFGILTLDVARKLGQLCYGIYLFHGILFFLFFRFFLGYATAAHLSSFQHWLCVFLLTPIIVLVSYLLHIYVEMPALKYSSPLSRKVSTAVSFFNQRVTLYWNQVMNTLL